MTNTRLLRSITSVIVLTVVAPGCSEAPPPPPPKDLAHEIHINKLPTITILDIGKNSLKGKIKHKGEPIVTGRLFFMGDKGMVPLVGRINPDGSYLVGGLPEGEFCVCVLLDPNGPLPFPTLPPPPGSESQPNEERNGRGGDTENPRTRNGRGEPPPLLGGLPPDVTDGLVDYTVPAAKKALYSKLHERYAIPGKANTLKVTLKAGENTKDFDLP